MSDKGLDDLPASNDDEFWLDGERHHATPIKLPICETHGSDNWASHRGYIDNKDGTISCKFCPWGTRIPGWYRVVDEHIVDLRDLSRR